MLWSCHNYVLCNTEQRIYMSYTQENKQGKEVKKREITGRQKKLYKESCIEFASGLLDCSLMILGPIT